MFLEQAGDLLHPDTRVKLNLASRSRRARGWSHADRGADSQTARAFPQVRDDLVVGGGPRSECRGAAGPRGAARSHSFVIIQGGLLVPYGGGCGTAVRIPGAVKHAATTRPRRAPQGPFPPGRCSSGACSGTASAASALPSPCPRGACPRGLRPGRPAPAAGRTAGRQAHRTELGTPTAHSARTGVTSRTGSRSAIHPSSPPSPALGTGTKTWPPPPPTRAPRGTPPSPPSRRAVIARCQVTGQVPGGRESQQRQREGTRRSGGEPGEHREKVQRRQ